MFAVIVGTAVNIISLEFYQKRFSMFLMMLSFGPVNHNICSFSTGAQRNGEPAGHQAGHGGG